jgi:hypothetical protein
MVDEFACKDCGATIAAKLFKPGQGVTCEGCGAVNVVPDSASGKSILLTLLGAVHLISGVVLLVLFALAGMIHGFGGQTLASIALSLLAWIAGAAIMKRRRWAPLFSFLVGIPWALVLALVIVTQLGFFFFIGTEEKRYFLVGGQMHPLAVPVAAGMLLCWILTLVLLLRSSCRKEFRAR